MRKNSQQGIAHIIFILLILLAVLVAWFFISRPFQTKSTKPNPTLPIVNPFNKVKTNPYKDIKTNPFR